MTYARERLTLLPWAVIPPALYMLSRGPNEAFDGWILAFIYAAVFQLRAIDDFYCFSYDKERGANAHYLNEAPTRLIPWIASLSLAASLAAFFAMPIAEFFATLIFFAAHPPVYRLMQRRRGLLAVSLAKYPFLMFLVASLNARPEYLWPALGTVFFLAREGAEELFGIRRTYVEVGVVGSLIVTRLIDQTS